MANREGLVNKIRKVIGLEDEIDYDDPQEEYGEYEGYDEYGSYEGRNSGYHRASPEPAYTDNPRVTSMPSGSARSAYSSRTAYESSSAEQGGKVIRMNGSDETSTARRTVQKEEMTMKLVITDATDLNDCPKLVDNLRSGKPVILNMGTIKDNSGKHKIFNFMSGATYAVDGKIQKITDEIFIFASKNVEVLKIENDENGNPKNVSMKDMSWR